MQVSLSSEVVADQPGEQISPPDLAEWLLALPPTSSLVLEPIRGQRGQRDDVGFLRGMRARWTEER